MNGSAPARRWLVELPDGTMVTIHPGVLLNPHARHSSRTPMRWSCQHVDTGDVECHAPALYKHDAPKNWSRSVDGTTARTNPVGVLSARWCREHVPAGGYNVSTRRPVAPRAA